MVLLTARATPSIVVAGDALVDLTSTRTIRGAVGYEPHPGGSCLNVAMGLGRLGVAASLLARISSDGFGRFLREHLAASGVLPDHLIPTDDLTTLAIADIRGADAGYAFHSADCADRGLLPEHLTSLPDGGRLPPGAALHLGSIALAQEPQASTLDGLLRRESGRRLVSLDPNVRASLIADHDSYLARLEGWVALSDVVKASVEDLAWLYPGEEEAAVTERWLAAGPALVVITAGAEGARAATAVVQVAVRASPVEVVDTVGAGDAFTAMLLAQLSWAGRLDRAAVGGLGEAELTELVRVAAWAGSDTCTRAGAQPPYLSELPQRPSGSAGSRL